MLGHTLMKHVPGIQTKTGCDHHGHREAVQPQTNEQRGESPYQHPTILMATGLFIHSQVADTGLVGCVSTEPR